MCLLVEYSVSVANILKKTWKLQPVEMLLFSLIWCHFITLDSGLSSPSKGLIKPYISVNFSKQPHIHDISRKGGNLHLLILLKK